MKKLWLLALVGVMLGAIGCTGSGDKAADGDKDGKSAANTSTDKKADAAYVGTYGIEMPAAEMAKMEKAKADAAKLPAKQRAASEKMLADVTAAIAKAELVINADGTFEMKGTPDGKDVKGTYTAEGNTLTLTAPSEKKPLVVEYNEAEKTLSKKGDKSMVFKKK